MARLVQGMRNIVNQSVKTVRLSAAPRTIAQQRCLHSIQLTGMAAPGLLRNVQVNRSIYTIFIVRIGYGKPFHRSVCHILSREQQQLNYMFIEFHLIEQVPHSLQVLMFFCLAKKNYSNSDRDKNVTSFCSRDAKQFIFIAHKLFTDIIIY